jgi:hypothetical protein
MHFFGEAFETGYKEYQMQFTLYMGRAKLNLLIAQFGKCKEDALEALKIKDTDAQMWLLLARSRYFLEKWVEGMKYLKQGLEKCPGNDKLLHMKEVFDEMLEKEQIIMKDIGTMSALKSDKKLEVYRNLRSKKVKIGKRVHHLPESLDLQISLDEYKLLHFPVLILYDEFMQTDFV